jgi:hypothetical protein
MMAEQLWRFARGFVLDDLTNEEAATIRRYLEPVSPSALLIKDFDAAVERMTYAVPNELTFKAPEILRLMCTKMLRAAVREDDD